MWTWRNTLGACAEAQRADAYEAALNSLDLCARTRQELRRSLLARGLCARRGGSDARPPCRQRPHRRPPLCRARRGDERRARRGRLRRAPQIARQGHWRGGRGGGAGRAGRRAAGAGRAGGGALRFCASTLPCPRGRAARSFRRRWRGAAFPGKPCARRWTPCGKRTTGTIDPARQRTMEDSVCWRSHM